MYKENYIFPAIIEKLAENDYNVRFPDFDGIITTGDNIGEAYSMAEDALSLELFDLYSDKIDIPKETDITSICVKENQTLILVKVSLKEIIKKYDDKAVKKTLTIPSWLNRLAIEENINFSQVLQNALEEKLKVKNMI